MIQLTGELQRVRERLVDVITSYGSVMVAYSGGVDSALVAKAAYDALGKRSCAVTAVSPSLASGELNVARQIAQDIGIDHKVISTDEFESASYIANAPNRCYFCKSELYIRLAKIKQDLGISVIANGANTDDLGDHRPGLKAAQEFEVRSPLVEADLSKAMVRELARAWGLRIWNKPAMPCLSSRIAYGVEVTEERVGQIDQCEQFLRQLGFRELRVRYPQADVARIEIPLGDVERIIQTEVRESIVAFFRSVGFKSITLDLEGFRSGSMNAFVPSDTLKAYRVTTDNH